VVDFEVDCIIFLLTSVEFVGQSPVSRHGWLCHKQEIGNIPDWYVLKSVFTLDLLMWWMITVQKYTGDSHSCIQLDRPVLPTWNTRVSTPFYSLCFLCFFSVRQRLFWCSWHNVSFVDSFVLHGVRSMQSCVRVCARVCLRWHHDRRCNGVRQKRTLRRSRRVHAMLSTWSRRSMKLLVRH